MPFFALPIFDQFEIVAVRMENLKDAGQASMLSLPVLVQPPRIVWRFTLQER
jgi:hypothetical protein